MLDRLRNAVVKMLHINPAPKRILNVTELLDFDANVQLNRIWYRGDPYELEQVYSQVKDNSFGFWGARQTKGMEVRKIHTGLPKVMVDMIAGLVMGDFEKVDFDSVSAPSLWDEFTKKNDFMDIVKTAIAETLAFGDGAFKISVNSQFSEYPILEFYPADRIRVKKEHDFIYEVVFLTPYKIGYTVYTVEEHYGYGYVKYAVIDNNGNEVSTQSVSGLENLQDVCFNGNFMMAQYLSFYKSGKYEGRGQSVYDMKRGNFDALDEAWSQWMDALRAGRTKTYIPDVLIPRDNNGVILTPNSFDNRYIQCASDMKEGSQNRITTEQSNIPHESYLATYITALDLCLQGLISPSTLGIDTKKLDNAEAQREKEKTTLYTRQVVVGALQKALPKIITAMFNVNSLMNGTELEEPNPSIKFGEYANPSFESQVETVAKARAAKVMSIEASVDELYGDTQTDEWKSAEVERIKAENGLMECPDKLSVDMVDEP